MFFSLRFLLFFIGLAWRWYYRPKWKNAFDCNGKDGFLWLSRNKQGIEGWKIAVALPTAFRFRFDKETALDRWLKRLGLACEFQTGHPDFDQSIYIACDHPGLHQALEARPDLRKVILGLMRSYREVGSDGKLLWLAKTSHMPPDQTSYAKLGKLARAFEAALPEMRITAAPYLKRVLVCEVLLLLLVCYTVAGIGAAMLTREEFVHFDTFGLFWRGLIFSVVLGLAVFFLWRKILGKSSWFARCMSGNIWLLLFCAPAAGVLLFGDMNRHLDNAPSTVLTAQVEGTTTKASRLRSRRRTTFYVNVVSPVTDGVKLANGKVLSSFPEKVKVTQSSYNLAKSRGRHEVFFIVKPGWWGLPWCEKYVLQPAGAVRRW